MSNWLRIGKIEMTKSISESWCQNVAFTDLKTTPGYGIYLCCVDFTCGFSRILPGVFILAATGTFFSGKQCVPGMFEHVLSLVRYF